MNFFLRQFSIFFFLFTLLSAPLWAQRKSLPTEGPEFLKAYDEGVKRLTAEKVINDELKLFADQWNLGTYNPKEQAEFILLTNKMLESSMAIYPQCYALCQLYLASKRSDVFGQIPLRETVEVLDSSLSVGGPQAITRLLRILKDFYIDGSVFRTGFATWKFTENNPKISFRKITEPNTGKKIPVAELTFLESELIYRSKVDSTVIHRTGGALNLLSLAWKGKHGSIDWAKVKTPEVYCEFDHYSLNLNYSRVEIDTVNFFYKSLLDKSLKGKFIDVNRGFTDPSRTDYPLFFSYEGGVTITNFIPNVRYQGGFSLRGVKKIGSSYWEWQDIPENKKPKKEEEPKIDPEVAKQYEGFDYYNIPDEEVYSLPSADQIEKAPDSLGYGDEEKKEGEAPEELGTVDPADLEFEMMLAGKEMVEKKAALEIVRGDRTIAKLLSKEFAMDLKKLYSKDTEIIIYLGGGEDSVYHPNLELLYETESDLIYAMRDVKEIQSRTPIGSSYHRYNMYFDALKWDRKSDKITMTAIIDKANTPGAIESEDYFQKARFHQFKGVLPLNPIMGVSKYAYFHPGEDIYVEDIVKYLEIPQYLEAFKLAMPSLYGSGFIDLKSDGEIIPLPRLNDWAMAGKGDKDFDAIQITSSVESGPQGIMNLVSKEIDLFGVKFFSLSDSNYIRVVPTKEKIKVLGDRDLMFGGIIAAGKLNFFGQDSTKFRFEYENYKIACDSLDSLRFILVRNPPPGFKFSPLQIALRNTAIEGVTGAIYINKIDNKSGREMHHEYSIFDSYTNSYIYWQRDSIHGGVYKKDKFYFSIDPFVLDSLERFDETKLSFEGEFFSSEIFPRIRQRLAVMEDQTLGMQYITPPDTGLALYEGKGRFKNELTLDGSGLHGDGTIESMATLVNSERFEFFFDSVRAVTKDFYLPPGERDGATFPEIKAAAVNYKWLTKEDKVELTTLDGQPIEMFGGKGKFEGKIVITKEGVFGDGTLKMGEVTIESHKINFSEDKLVAEDGALRIADTKDPTKFHFIAEKLHLEYDVKGDKADFVGTSSGEAHTAFPMNNYMSSLSKGTWDKNVGAIHIEGASQYPKNNFFFSSDPTQDSLNFMATAADYTIGGREIAIEGVPFVISADARIIPDTGKVQIKPDGFLRRMENARIEATLENNYHKIYDGKIEILSRHNYKGEGKYDYIPVNDQEQFIQFTEINVDNDTHTVAVGTIEDKQKFHLTDKIFFKGKTFLQAQNKFMRFTGEVRIESKNPFFRDTWFPFDEVVNPDTVFIPIRKEDTEAKGLFAGLYFIPQYRSYYSTFIQPKKDKKDLEVNSASGVLTVSRETGEFTIGNKAKLSGENYRGAKVSYNDELNTITNHGNIALPTNFEKGTIEMMTAGSWRDDMDKKEITTDFLLGVRMDVIPKEAWSKLADNFRMAAIALTDVDYNNRELIESASEFLDQGLVDEKNTEKFVKEVDNALLSSDIKLAKYVPHQLLLSGVKFQFHPNYKSLYANGEFGILGFGSEPINKLVNMKLEYNMGFVSPNGVRTTDTLQVYIEVDENNWIFFKFAGPIIWTFSSNIAGYNYILNGEIAKRKKAEGFRFELATDADKDDFLSRFINRYIWQE